MPKTRVTVLPAKASRMRLDDRNAAGDRRLVVEQHALLLGDLGKRHAMLGKQRLVGGHDMAAGVERGTHAGTRRALVAAHQFDEDVDIGLLGHFDRIVEPLRAAEVDAAIARRGRGPKRR